jgi:hypothetical protein
MDQKEIAAKEEEDRQERLANQESTREFLRSKHVAYPRHVSFAQIVDRAIGKMNWSRDEVYRKLLDAFDRGFFGPDLHFADMKHSGVEGSEYELQTLTKKDLIEVFCSYEAETVRDHYLAHCWVDIATANRWLEAEGVESSFVTERDSQSSELVRGAAPVDVAPPAAADNTFKRAPAPRPCVREGKQPSVSQTRLINLAEIYDGLTFELLDGMHAGTRFEKVTAYAEENGKKPLPGQRREQKAFAEWRRMVAAQRT